MGFLPASSAPNDGIHSMVAREQMTSGARRLRDAYDRVPNAPLYRREFGFYSLERWAEEGMPQDQPLETLFQFDVQGEHLLGQLGGCEAAFCPLFEVRQIEDRGDTEVVQDFAGRQVLYFKNRRNGFMPEYLDHPVKGQKSWEENVKWRLAPAAPGRFADLDARMAAARLAAGRGEVIVQNVVGGYMYLRSLIGPSDLLYMFYDHPELIHDCMQSWLQLADAVIQRHQTQVSLDMVLLDEDICYNHGALIGPDMIREFLLPYYQQLLGNIRGRQLDPHRRLLVHVDSDGFCDPVIPLYRDAIGLDMMSPFEVASACDVVRTGREYPDLVLSGGIDKRVLAKSKRDIDLMLERILPAMRARGGYVPTVDHGVPAEVPYENYLHFRQRMVELGG